MSWLAQAAITDHHRPCGCKQSLISHHARVWEPEVG